MSDQPLVTIVTPSFNQARFLEATIQSVFNQTYPNIEYIIIDGGSTDNSKKIIQKYADQLAYWVSEPDKGQTEAINKGFAKATGKYLAWLNSDDTYEPHAVAEAVALLEENPELGLVYGDAHVIDENSQPMWKFPARQTDYKKLRWGYVHIPQQSAFWRADLWKRVGPLDPSFYFAMDYDLWVRLAEISQLRYYSRVWANFRFHDDSKTIMNDVKGWEEMIRVHERDGGAWLSIIRAKYYLRLFITPWLNWRRRRRISNAGNKIV